MSEFVRVAAVSELPPGSQRIVEVRGQEVALFNVRGTLYAIDNTCPHAGFPLGDGDTNGEYVICPGHSYNYDLRTGECLNDPDKKVTCFRIKVEGNDVMIAV